MDEPRPGTFTLARLLGCLSLLCVGFALMGTDWAILVSVPCFLGAGASIRWGWREAVIVAVLWTILFLTIALLMLQFMLLR